MSIPSADHTIYSFITLCLKEQGDIAGRKEITASTARRRSSWDKKKVGCHHLERHIFVTALRCKSRGFYLGMGDEKAWASQSTQFHLVNREEKRKKIKELTPPLVEAEKFNL